MSHGQRGTGKMVSFLLLLHLSNERIVYGGMMDDYKQKIAQMWQSEAPTVADLLDVVADFCDDLGSRPELYTDIYDTAGKIFACVGMVTEQRDAEIERLRAALAQTWQPINNSKVPCTEFATGGANQHGDYLVVWSNELNEGTVHLPDDVRLCRKVTP